MKRQADLQEVLEGILGSRNVYFQAPESIKMSFPAIQYSLEKIDTDYANNKKYRQMRCYKVTAIDYDPESELVDKLLELDYCEFDRAYVKGNLNYFVFTLFY